MQMGFISLKRKIKELDNQKVNVEVNLFTL